MTQLSTRLYPNPLITFNTATLTGSYLIAGILPASARIIKFKNSSTVAVTISWDGVIDHDHLLPDEFTLLDVSTNREVNTEFMEIHQGQPFFVKGSGGTGNIYISSWMGY